jgi:asparagine synthase (glutamine-hydrolysing)
MCGIAGTIAREGIDTGALRSMADAIAHRGPDGEGYLAWHPQQGLRIERGGGAPPPGPASVGFAHRRLSIIDLRPENDQPLANAAGDLALAFNGEIYNYLELRRELEGLGRSFVTEGDTEVLLAAYEQWGSDCLQRLVGMWAFALLDLRREIVLLSRDRFGVKPLYWSGGGASPLHFASEIKALLAVPGVLGDPDEATVRRFLLTGAVDESERTFFEGIRSLPPAHNVVVPLAGDGATPSPRRYWDIPEEGYGGGFEEAAGEFRHRLTDSVAVHARSDVPVGSCLSGGLDSSSIVCVAEELRREGRIPAYAHSGFGYVAREQEVSERRHMEEVARATSLQMHYIEVPPERFSDALVEIVRQQDEPFGTTSIAAQWFVFERAKKEGMKVMLDGQGADELLAGYHGYFPLIGPALLRSRRPLEYLRFSRAHRRRFGTAPMSRRQALAELRAGPGATAMEAPPPPATAAVLSERLAAALEPADNAWQRFDSVHELLAAHTRSLGLPSLLRFEDRNSMAHSIEARVPFLDHRLAELCFRLPASYKLRGVETKSVLREAMRGILPEPIRTRSDKIGFRADPTAAWKLAEAHRASLAEAPSRWERDWFEPAAVERLLDGADRSGESEALLWRVINTKIWLRSFWGEGPALG